MGGLTCALQLVVNEGGLVPAFLGVLTSQALPISVQARNTKSRFTLVMSLKAERSSGSAQLGLTN